MIHKLSTYFWYLEKRERKTNMPVSIYVEIPTNGVETEHYIDNYLNFLSLSKVVFTLANK